VIRKSATEDPSLVQVRFSVPGEMHSSDVFLVGDFNDWDSDDTPLVTDGNGMVVATLMLEAGKKYAFRYRTKDGRWFNDECADDYEPNEFGGSNGILTT
jgi:1,4-alpha-glucan branching enzyme